MTPTVQTLSPSEDADRDVPVIEMVQPLAGFPALRHFALGRLDESGIVYDLRSLDDPELRFVVVPPGPFFSEYDPAIDETMIAELGVEQDEDLLALLVVTLGSTAETATANLLAPVLVNHRTRRAGQYLLDDAALPMRAPLSAASGSAST
ncbi:MAG: flagellar assembly factor FliW [Nocardioidaceae bacterium]|nr:flagellar assembly factor FliW [Nocardioidaceae bacterium]